MSSTDAEWAAERGAERVVERTLAEPLAQEQEAQAAGAAASRVVYEYDHNANANDVFPGLRGALPPQRDGTRTPLYVPHESDGTFFLPVYPSFGDKEMVSIRTQSTLKKANRNQMTCADAYGTVGSEARVPPPAPRAPRTATATPLYLCAFGITTILYSVHTAGITTHNMATMGLVMFYGGLTQFICGFFELINMNALGCTISATYGAFGMATAYMFNVPVDASADLALTQGATSDFLGGFFLSWFFFAASLFACAFTDSTPLLGKLLFFLVPLNFLLQSIGNFALVPVLITVAGYIGIVMGALATYLGIAFQMRDVYGRSILPLIFMKGFRFVEL